MSLNRVDLPTPLRPISPTFVAGRNRHAGRIEEPAAPGVKDEVLDPKHVAGAELTMVVVKGALSYRAAPEIASRAMNFKPLGA